MKQHQVHKTIIAHPRWSLWSHQAHFMNDFSRFTWMYFLWSNLDTLKAVEEFKSSAEKSKFKIMSLRSDQGGKYLSKGFTALCKEHSIPFHSEHEAPVESFHSTETHHQPPTTRYGWVIIKPLWYIDSTFLTIIGQADLEPTTFEEATKDLRWHAAMMKK